MQPWCGTGEDVKLGSCHLYAPGPLIAPLSSPCMGHLSVCLHLEHLMARVIKRWLSSACAGRGNFKLPVASQTRVVSDRGGGFLSRPLPPSHPISVGPQVGLLNNHGADPTRLTFFYSSWGCWNTSRQTKDTLKQRSATQHVCLGAEAAHLLTLRLTTEKRQHRRRQNKTVGHKAAQISEQNLKIGMKKNKLYF